jgi:hypothetical protein
MRKPIVHLKLDEKVNFILNRRYSCALTKLHRVNTAYISQFILRIIFTNFLRIMLAMVMNNIFYFYYYLNMYSISTKSQTYNIFLVQLHCYILLYACTSAEAKS